MRQKIWKAFINFEKEEKWLNDMSARGLNLIDYTFLRYLFEEGKSGEYIYRIELLDKLPGHPESKSYIKFMEETGAECVATYYRWVYFRKKSSDGPFDLYSDYDSRIKHYKKIAIFQGIVGAINLAAAILNLALGISNGLERGFYFNAYISVANWLIAIILIPILISYVRKIMKMKKEKQIYE